MSLDSTDKSVILIVDDSPTNLEVLFDFLEDSGFKVLVAEDGESAIARVEYAPPDLILLDVVMPGMDGFETCRRLKANESTKDIPVIFMTALSETVDKVRGLNLGAVDYITKPLQHEEILARVKIHLSLRNLSKTLTEQNVCLEQEIQERKRVEEDLRRYTAELAEWKNRYEAVIQASGQILYDWDSHTNDITYAGDIERILGYSGQEMLGGLNRFIELVHPDDRNLFNQEIKRVLSTKEPLHLRFRVCRKDGRYITVEDNGYFFLDSTGKIDHMVGFVVDITDRKRAESLVGGQTRLLEMIATGASLPDVLDSLTRMIEEHSTGMLCSILLLDQNGINLRHGAAPSLPETYNSAINGLALGPNVGSCGTAAYLGKPIIVSDIASDPLWTEFRDLALSHELRACWSTPILSTNGSVLGTFAMYYCEPNSPSPQDLQLAGIATHIAGVAIERKQAQEEREQAFTALQESEARFRRLVESNIIGIVFADLKGNITEANDAFLQMVGYTHEDLLSGKLCWDNLTRSQYRYLNEGGLTEFISSGACTAFEKEFISKDGTPVPAMVGGALLEQSQQGTVCFVLDITERKQAEQKIRQQAALLDSTTDAILVRDLGNKIRFWNKGAERLYGWKAEEALGKNADKLLYRETSQLQNNQKSLAEDDSWQGELHQVTKEGKDIVVATRWNLVRNEEGQPKSILTVNTDITEKKQLEAQFLRAQRMESLGTLASGIAHDLNNALTPMLMTVQLLERKLQDKQSQQWLSILETNIKRGADLVKQVLSFARGVEGKHTTLQMRHLISEIEKIAKQTFSRAIEIRTDIPTQNLWTVSGDATQLHQVLMNLCVNARDAMAEGGILEISARNLWIDENYARMNLDAKVGPYVVITISDTGMGIKSEIVDRIFEPFFTTKELGKGTGLGLSTVIGIIKSHGGFVNVHSEVGKGTQFKVYLPVTKTRETDGTAAGNQELPAGHGELILVVDDEDSIREITKTSLETYGYKVLVASDGIEAIALYTQHKEEISVVLIDMMMPSMDGPTTIRVLQKINPQIKIIAVSGLVSNDQMIEIIGSNVKTFLPKPYTSNELLKNLQLVLSTN